MKYARWVIALLSACCVTASLGHAQLPRALTYQGALTQADGAPMTGSVQMAFALYASADAATPLWSAPSANVSVTHGIYTVTLGETPFVGAPALSALPFDTPYFLAVTVNGATLTPRHQLTAAPYALRAASVEGLTLANGKVGIGTTAPQATLDVAGPITVSSSSAPLFFTGTTASGAPVYDGARLRYDHHFFGAALDALVVEKTDGNENAPDGGIAVVMTGADQQADLAVAIRGDGKVGIGTPTPAYTLDVNGPVRASGDLWTTGAIRGLSDLPLTGMYSNQDPWNSRAYLEMWGADTARSGELRLAGAYVDLVFNSTTAGYGSIGIRLTKDGNVGIGTTAPQSKLDVNGTIRGAMFVTTSDARLKTDIAPIADALAKMTQLRGVTFRWKDAARGDGTQIGLIAQDVAPVFPELVSTGSDGEQSLAYAQMVAPLIEAVKTLKADNDALTAELAEMRRRVNTLETQAHAHPR